jgi:hypothetical protein
MKPKSSKRKSTPPGTISRPNVLEARTKPKLRGTKSAGSQDAKSAPPDLAARQRVKFSTRPKKTAPRTAREYIAKPDRFKDTWEKVLSVISSMRSDQVSLTQASHDVGISPRTVMRWGKSALRKQKSGKYAAKAKDDLLRLLQIPTPEGTGEIGVRGSKDATLLAEYWNAVHHYLQTGDTSQLKRFRCQEIIDADGTIYPFLTDPSVLNRLGSAGVLSFESLYARAA